MQVTVITNCESKRYLLFRQPIEPRSIALLIWPPLRYRPIAQHIDTWDTGVFCKWHSPQFIIEIKLKLMHPISPVSQLLK